MERNRSFKKFINSAGLGYNPYRNRLGQFASGPEAFGKFNVRQEEFAIDERILSIKDGVLKSYLGKNTTEALLTVHSVNKKIDNSMERLKTYNEKEWAEIKSNKVKKEVVQKATKALGESQKYLGFVVNDMLSKAKNSGMLRLDKKSRVAMNKLGTQLEVAESFNYLFLKTNAPQNYSEYRQKLEALQACRHTVLEAINRTKSYVRFSPEFIQLKRNYLSTNPNYFDMFNASAVFKGEFSATEERTVSQIRKAIREGNYIQSIALIKTPNGMYTILDGNHRMRAFYLEGKIPQTTVYQSKSEYYQKDGNSN